MKERFRYLVVLFPKYVTDLLMKQLMLKCFRKHILLGQDMRNKDQSASGFFKMSYLVFKIFIGQNEAKLS